MAVLDPNELLQQQQNEETTKMNLITPVIQKKWQTNDKIIMEYYYTNGRISIDEYNVAHRGKPKKVDYLLLWKDNILLALVEAKGQDHSADDGYSQAVDYARDLDVPFAYATNGIELIEKDMITGINKHMKVEDFPTPDDLWSRYLKEKGVSADSEAILEYPYYQTIGGKKPRYYQRIAINRTVEHIAKGSKRALLVMATGTGKTFTAFQIIYRFWKMRKMKKILFLADRNILVDQTMRKDFAPFTDAMVKFNNDKIDTSKDVYLALYQQLKSSDTEYYKKFPRDFFDLIVIDEAHRGSASEDSSWHEILTWFSDAVQIGMTATPKDGGIEEAMANEEAAMAKLQTAISSNNLMMIDRLKKEFNKAHEIRVRAEESSNMAYFGNPIYTYSLKQGIEDGFLAPYKVISVELDIDKNGYTPASDKTDIDGNPVEQRTYTQEEFDRKIIVEERRQTVAERVTEFMKVNDCRYAKTIVFCESIEHAQDTVRRLENLNADLVAEDPRYIMQITGDNDIGKAQLDNFVDPNSKYPVIAVTSRLMSTGVDAETCKIIVLDRTIGSMTEFKQIIGRGTRVKEKFECDGEEDTKMYFSILDFRKNYLKFNDPAFDGDPVTVTLVDPDKPFTPPPVKPITPTKTPPKKPDRIARINGVDVEIVGEEVRYLDQNGHLVTQNLDICVRNNILTQYPTYEEFKAAWAIAQDKARFANELLLDDGENWVASFLIRYGYKVDEFDIIAYFGYDIEPPMSKKQRTQNTEVVKYLSMFEQEKRDILRGLLDAYADSSFVNLKDIKNTFSHGRFKDYGNPLAIVKKYFGTKEKYYAVLKELEKRVYE
ncbi:MAG: DEAD/DEAH box helicase family protein [Lactobacillus johnsonii]|nr:DEAD/DEAH box helicase family protein [Lactobacillus johnsonii]